MNIVKKILKLRISLAEHNGGRGVNPLTTLSGRLRRQIEDDPDLYHHWKSEQELSETLREKTGAPVPVPSNLRARILAQVAEEAPVGKGVPFRTGWGMAATAVVVAFGTVFIVLQQEKPGGMEIPERPVIENTVEQPAAPITLETPVENHPLVQLSSLIESPLREEPQRLFDDAENALRFLTRNFTPKEEWREEVARRILGG